MHWLSRAKKVVRLLFDLHTPRRVKVDYEPIYLPLSPVTDPVMPRAFVYVDGCCKGNPGPCGVGASFLDEQGSEFHTIAADVGMGTNNTAEYKAVLRAMWEAIEKGIPEIHIYSDSALVVNQINGRNACRQEGLRPLYYAVMQLICRFRLVTVTQIPREKNQRADRLANEGFYSAARTDDGGSVRLLHSEATEPDLQGAGTPLHQ